jgi:hypothetical protein
MKNTISIRSLCLSLLFLIGGCVSVINPDNSEAASETPGVSANQPTSSEVPGTISKPGPAEDLPRRPKGDVDTCSEVAQPSAGNCHANMIDRKGAPLKCGINLNLIAPKCVPLDEVNAIPLPCAARSANACSRNGNRRQEVSCEWLADKSICQDKPAAAATEDKQKTGTKEGSGPEATSSSSGDIPTSRPSPQSASASTPAPAPGPRPSHPAPEPSRSEPSAPPVTPPTPASAPSHLEPAASPPPASSPPHPVAAAAPPPAAIPPEEKKGPKALTTWEVTADTKRTVSEAIHNNREAPQRDEEKSAFEIKSDHMRAFKIRALPDFVFLDFQDVGVLDSFLKNADAAEQVTRTHALSRIRIPKRELMLIDDQKNPDQKRPIVAMQDFGFLEKDRRIANQYAYAAWRTTAEEQKGMGNVKITVKQLATFINNFPFYLPATFEYFPLGRGTDGNIEIVVDLLNNHLRAEKKAAKTEPKALLTGIEHHPPILFGDKADFKEVLAHISGTAGWFEFMPGEKDLEAAILLSNTQYKKHCERVAPFEAWLKRKHVAEHTCNIKLFRAPEDGKERIYADILEALYRNLPERCTSLALQRRLVYLYSELSRLLAQKQPGARQPAPKEYCQKQLTKKFAWLRDTQQQIYHFLCSEDELIIFG